MTTFIRRHIYDSVYLAEIEGQLMAFQTRYEQTAKPSKWTFSRADLKQLLAKIMPPKQVEQVAV